MNSGQDNEPNTSSSYVDNLEDSWIPKIKRRRRFTVDETRVLENEFRKNSSPNQEKIQRIANRISTPRKIVTTWFQNRRAKNKRKEKLLREEKATAERERKNHNERDYLISRSSHITDNESTSDEEGSYKSNYDSESESDHNAMVNNPDNNQHSPLIPVQQSIENFNIEESLDDTTLVTQPFHALNNYVLTTLNHSNTANPNAFNIPNGQLYNINIYNNMSNHFISQEHNYGYSNEAPTMRHYNNNYMNHQHFLNFFYCQQQFSPFFMNNNLNFPSQSPSSSENDSICINPNDLYLNYFPQNRYRQQQHAQQQMRYLQEEEFKEDSE